MIGWHYVGLIFRIIIQLKWCVSVLCRVCHLFPPLVSIFGLFPVLVECHYELILVQLCFSKYLWLSCVFIVLSVQFDFVWSTRYSPMSVLPCLGLMSTLKTVVWAYPRLRVPRSSLVCAPWQCVSTSWSPVLLFFPLTLLYYISLIGETTALQCLEGNLQNTQLKNRSHSILSGLNYYVPTFKVIFWYNALIVYVDVFTLYFYF